MLGLPKSTEFNKRIPKQKFYKNMDTPMKIKKVFVDQVKTIYWKNKIAESTMNLVKGENVMEIEIFEVRLNSQLQDDSLLRQIDRQIPYHILFLLEYQNKYQAWIGYKEASVSGKAAFKVNNYYHTDWVTKDNLLLEIQGLNMDDAYENYVRQIAGNKLHSKEAGESLKISVERDEQKQILQKRIEVLKNKIRKEKQLNKQMEMNTEIKKLKRKLEEL